MHRISNRTWLVIGFALSLLSVVTNILVVSALNERVRTVDADIAKVESTIRTQTADIDRADFKLDFFRVLHHISKLSKDDEHKAAGRTRSCSCRII